MSRPPVLDGAVRADEGTLIGQTCSGCSACYFPVAERCPACGSAAVTSRRLSGEGAVYSWTVVRRPPPGLTAPYVVAWVDTPEGPRLFGQVAADPERLRTGMQVSVRFGTPPAGGPEDAFHFAPSDEAPGDRRSR